MKLDNSDGIATLLASNGVRLEHRHSRLIAAKTEGGCDEISGVRKYECLNSMERDETNSSIHATHTRSHLNRRVAALPEAIGVDAVFSSRGTSAAIGSQLICGRRLDRAAAYYRSFSTARHARVARAGTTSNAVGDPAPTKIRRRRRRFGEVAAELRSRLYSRCPPWTPSTPERRDFRISEDFGCNLPMGRSPPRPGESAAFSCPTRRQQLCFVTDDRFTAGAGVNTSKEVTALPGRRLRLTVVVCVARRCPAHLEFVVFHVTMLIHSGHFATVESPPPTHCFGSGLLSLALCCRHASPGWIVPWPNGATSSA